MSEELKDLVELFAQTGEIQNVEERQAFAAALQLPINRYIEADNIARTIFTVDHIGPEGSAIYPKDIAGIDAWVVPSITSAPQNLVGMEEIHVPTFAIDSSVEWTLALARQRRFDIVRRQAVVLRDAIVRKENEIAWELVRGALSPDRTVALTGETTLTKSAYNKGFQMMTSKDGFKVDLVIANAKRASDIREWSSNDLDPTTMREVWRSAGIGNIWGADIITFNELEDNEVFFFDTSRLGAMPIKQDFTTFDDPTAITKFRQRVLGYEDVGFVVFDANAIVKVELDQ